MRITTHFHHWINVIILYPTEGMFLLKIFPSIQQMDNRF